MKSSGHLELVNLAEDPSETQNVADGHPDLVQQLSAAFDAWLAPMADPINGGSKRTDVKSVQRELTPREKEREKIRAQRRQQREAERKVNKQAELSSAP